VRAAAPRVEARVEAPWAEAPRAETPRALETPRSDASGVEAPRGEQARVEPARVEPARIEPARIEAARDEVPWAEPAAPVAPPQRPASAPEPERAALDVRESAPDYFAPPAAAAPRAGAAGIADADAWHDLVAGSGLRGPARLLAEHAGFVGYADGVLRLSLPATDEHLQAPALIKMVADALAPRLGGAPQIRFESAQAGESLRERNERARDQRQASAEDAFMNDPDVQRLISQHGARVVPDSIRPFDEA